MSGAKTEAYIRAHGADAVTFLHAQLTCRVDNLETDANRMGAWCNAKGRVRAIFRLGKLDGDIVMRLPASLVPLILPRLKMFVLRSQVQLTQIEENTENFGRASALFQARDELAEVLAGVPEIYPITSELFLPQMLNLDQLGAIDFKKGCYPGQEIVARTQYLGQLKRRMLLANSSKIPEPGTAISNPATGEKSGTVVRAAWASETSCAVLAVLPLDPASWTDLVLDTENQPALAVSVR